VSGKVDNFCISIELNALRCDMRLIIFKQTYVLLVTWWKNVRVMVLFLLFILFIFLYRKKKNNQTPWL
jgi:hypothetical protein